MRKNSNLDRWVNTSVLGVVVRAFFPPPLPPVPPIDLASAGILTALQDASVALGRLDGMASILPDTDLFIYSYVRKEALLSSQIEGTQSSLSDLLLFENDAIPGVPLDDVREVSNYVAALEHGLRRLRGELPLSCRLINEMHAILLSNARGNSKQPGEFRRVQNWIGRTPADAHFIPPPPEHVPGLMSDLEKFIHSESERIPPLIRIALIHAQLETIHPYLDGNGRMGRLLITLMLCEAGILREPVLYLSLYLKANRARYYDLLQRTREEADWNSWIEFFLRGVATTANQAVAAARELRDLFEANRRRISALGRISASILRVHDVLLTNPVSGIPRAARKLGLSSPTVAMAMRQLQELGIVEEIRGKPRNRMFAYRDYLTILSRGAEPLARG